MIGLIVRARPRHQMMRGTWGDRARMLLDERGVTRREAEVLGALAERLSDSQIAARFYVSERTVEACVASLIHKLRVRDRQQLVDLALELDPSSAPATPLPASLELLVDPASFVGRTDERARLDVLWSRAAAGEQVMVIVRGEAGMGKSRIVAELAARAQAGGAQVLAGCCFEDARRSCEPFVHAISDDLRRRSDAETRGMVEGCTDSLVRIVPELAARVGVAAPGRRIAPVAERADLLEAIRHYLRCVAQGGPTLLVVEDLHWADSTTRDAVLHLARFTGRVPLMIVVTTRDSAPDVDEPLTCLFSELTGLSHVAEISLTGLGHGEVGELIANLDDDGDPAAIAEQTGGNPLLIREVARARAGEAGGTLSALLAHRYAQLSAADVATLDIASVLGAQFNADVLSQSMGRPLANVLESVERAESAGLLVAVPGRYGTFAFTHALFRSVHYYALSSTQRMRLHHQVALALQPRLDDDQFVPELARHWSAAVPMADPKRALICVRRAAEVAEHSLALDEAVDLYRRALEIADMAHALDPQARLHLLIRLGEVLNRCGDPDHRDVLMDAARVAREQHDVDALAAIAWALAQFGTSQTPGVADAEFEAIAEEALAGLGDEPTEIRARTLAALAAELGVSGDPERAFDLVHEALFIALDLDDSLTLGCVLLSYRYAARSADNAYAREATSDELLELGEELNEPIFTIVGLINRALSYREAGDLGACDATVEQYAALLGDRPVPPNMRAQLHLLRTMRLVLAGDLAGADEHARGLYALGTSGTFNPTRFYAPALMRIRHHQGRLPELVKLLETGSDMPVYATARALAYAHSNRFADATDALRPFAKSGFSMQRNSMQWLSAAVMACEVVEMTGDVSAARELSELLEPYSGRIAEQPTVVIAPVDFALAQVALTMGDYELAEMRAAKAVEASRARNTPVFLGRELLLTAEARRRFGDTTRRVAPLVDEALELAHRHGAHVITQDARRYGLVH